VNRTLPAILIGLVTVSTLLLGLPAASAAGAPDHLAFVQQPTAVRAGDPIGPAVTVEVLDSDGVLVTNQAEDVTLTLAGSGGGTLGGTTTRTSVDGIATFDDLSVDKVGTDYTLTANASGLSPDPVSDQFVVTGGDLATITVAPHDTTTKAGVGQPYTAEGFDSHGNDLGDVTAGTTFTIDAGSGVSSCPSATCTPTVPGDWTVTGNDSGITDTATLHVTVGDLASITISPQDATVVAGGTQDYTAEGFDSSGNDLGDVTGDTTFTIAAGSGATTCPSATCSPTNPGNWTVTGTDGSFTDTATLHVNAGDVVTIQVTPAGGTIAAGESQQYHAEGFNSAGHSLGDVTADTAFSIESGANGSCTGDTCTAKTAGDWDVTGTYTGGAPTDTVTLHVHAGSAAKLGFGTQPISTPAGVELPDVTVEVQDQFGNLVAGGPSGKVTLTQLHHPPGSHMAGGGPVRTVGGVATFRNLVFDTPGTGYTLKATGSTGLEILTQVVSAPFNIKGYTRVTLSAARGTIDYNGQVTLTAHLGSCLDGCALSIYDKTDMANPVASGSVDGHHNLIRLLKNITHNTTYVAVFAGDSRYRRAQSDDVRVNVRALVGSGLQGFKSTKGDYRIYPYHPSCPQKHTGCPTVLGWVTPDKHGQNLHFVLQGYVGGRWQTLSTTENVMHTDGTRSTSTIIWIYGGTSVRNVPLRTRASYGGDAANVGGASIWRYFKVV
jgi:hypothetical protein